MQLEPQYSLRGTGKDLGGCGGVKLSSQEERRQSWVCDQHRMGTLLITHISWVPPATGLGRLTEGGVWRMTLLPGLLWRKYKLLVF